MKRRYKLPIVLVVTLLILWFGVGFAAAYVFTNIERGRDFDDPADIAGTPVEAIELTTRDGVQLSAWHVKNNDERVVLFAHGIGSTRRQGMRTAEMYQDWGYSLIMVDARGHGKSQHAPCTVGWNERLDLLAARDFAHRQGYKEIAAHGISMGAATVLYSLTEDIDYAFIVLESSYDTIDNALRNRVAMVGAPYGLTWPFRVTTQWMTGVPKETLRPLDYAPLVTSPILFLAGDSEPELPVTETKGLFDACGSEDKTLHFFKGGRHQVFSGRFKEEYRDVLGEFVRRQSGDSVAADAA